MEEVLTGIFQRLEIKKEASPPGRNQYKWKPIKGKTYNCYITSNWSLKTCGNTWYKSFFIGFCFSRGNHYQYGYGAKRIDVILGISFWNINLWLKYDIQANDNAIKEVHTDYTGENYLIDTI